mmetsp:Transcript_16840/g.23560  ORF Transcript_16840/g.23560 Transcript_16840/m.23560 type:complete len:80 (-) Transcript_16840:520-759(-)
MCASSCTKCINAESMSIVAKLVLAEMNDSYHLLSVNIRKVFFPFCSLGQNDAHSMIHEIQSPPDRLVGAFPLVALESQP